MANGSRKDVFDILILLVESFKIYNFQDIDLYKYQEKYPENGYMSFSRH